MARVTPLQSVHEAYGALMAEYGPSGPPGGILVPQVQRGVGAEYAAIRRAGTGAAIVDLPQRGTVEVRGADRVAFLNRMVTQELKGMEPYRMRRSFWLNRKGRIDADLRIIALGPEAGDRMYLDLDVFAVERAVTTLGAFVIADDVEFVDRTEQMHRLALHGQGAAALLAAESEPVAGAAVGEMGPGEVAVVRMRGAEGAEVIVDRQDSTGEPGYELLMPAEAAGAVWERLARPDEGPPDAEGAAARPRDGDAERKAVRAGWHAFNIARIEAGWPLYMIDFGPDSLPHETGAIEDRVSFKKGCYLGQEIVARMQARGHPKQRLVGLRVEGEAEVAGGAGVFEKEEGGDPIGAVTSSAASPMLGSATVAFAMVKYQNAQAGAQVWVATAGGTMAHAVVQPSLVFWKR